MSSTAATTDTASLHGLRTIFNFAVVTYHTLFLLAFSLDHPSDARNLITGSVPAHVLSFLITLGNTSVDIFLLLSGFLLKRSFPDKRPTLRTAVRYTLFRYLRLAPAYHVIAFALWWLGKPECIPLSELCLLAFGDPATFCVSAGWSTSLDFLYHILLLPLLSSPGALLSILVLTPPVRTRTWLNLGKPSLPAPAAMTDVLPAEEHLHIISQQLAIPHGNFSLSDPTLVTRAKNMASYRPLYFGIPQRIAPVVVGVLLYSCMLQKNALYRAVRKFPTLSMISATFLWGFYHVVEEKYLIAPWAMLMHHSAGRLLVSVATAIVIMLTCTINDSPLEHRISRLLRCMLSCRLMTFLHHFSYVVYLLHLLAAPALGLLPPKFTKDRLSPGWVLLLSTKLYCFTTLIGLPVWAVEKMALKGRSWLRRRTSRVVEDDHRKQKVS